MLGVLIAISIELSAANREMREMRQSYERTVDFDQIHKDLEQVHEDLDDLWSLTNEMRK
jgi:hypothetical protein